MPELVTKLRLGIESIHLLYETTMVPDRASLYESRKDCQQYHCLGTHDAFLAS